MRRRGCVPSRFQRGTSALRKRSTGGEHTPGGRAGGANPRPLRDGRRDQRMRARLRGAEAGAEAGGHGRPRAGPGARCGLRGEARRGPGAARTARGSKSPSRVRHRKMRTRNHGVVESFRLEKPLQIIVSNCLIEASPSCGFQDTVDSKVRSPNVLLRPENALLAGAGLTGIRMLHCLTFSFITVTGPVPTSG